MVMYVEVTGSVVLLAQLTVHWGAMSRGIKLEVFFRQKVQKVLGIVMVES